MPSVNQVQNLMPSGGQGVQIPLDVKQRMLAEQLAQETAAAPKAPYTSRAAGLVSALTGGLGGLMEGMDAQRVMQGNRNANATAMEFLRQYQQGQGGAAPTAASGQGAPSGQGGVGSDHVASTSNTDFINSIMPQAQRIAAQTGLDPRLVAAQAALESNYGKSAPGGNLFGIKGSGTGPLSTMESVNGQMVPTKASFASYDSPTASFDGYGKLMSGSRFAGVRGAQGLDAQLDALGKSGYATDPNYAAKVGAIARGLQVPSASPTAGQSASADMPAPNATPVASTTLPPGVTSDMLGPDASIRDHLMAAADQGAPSAAGSTPSSASSPTPDPSQSDPSLRDTIVAAAGQDNVPSPQPAGSSSAASAADPTLSPLPAATSAPLPDSNQGDDLRSTIIAAGQPQSDPDVPAPGSVPTSGTGLPPGVSFPPAATDDPSFDPEGTGSTNYDPSAAPSLRDTLTAAMQPQPGAGVPGAAPAPSGAPAPASGSPYGAMPTSLDQSPASVAGSNIDAASNLSPAGQVMSTMGPNGMDPSFTSTSATGGQSSMPSPVSAAPLSTDNLPGMDSFNAAGGVQQSSLGAAGFTGRDNATDPVTAATQGGLPGPQAYIGGDMGLGTSSTTPAPPAAGAQIPPKSAALVAALSQPSAPPSQPRGAALAAALQPGSGAALPQTGPMPPPGAQSLANAGLDPDAPAPGASNAGPAPLTSAMAQALMSQPQPMGLAGHSAAADPSSAQNFQRQQMLASMLGGSPAASGPSPQPAGSSPAAPAAPQGGGLFSGLFGGAQQPSPQAVSAPAGGDGQAPAGGQGDVRSLGLQVLNDPYASPEMKSMVMSRMFPQMSIEKTEDGKIVAVNPQNLSSRVIYDGSPKADWTVTPDGTRMINKRTSEVRPMPGYGDGSGGWRSMTSAERTQFGVADGRPAYMAPNGEPHFGQPETQGQGETAEAKTAGEGAATRRGEMIAAADAAPEKIARLKLLGTVLDNTQTGPLAEEVGNAASIAQRLGISNDRLKEIGVDPNQAVNNAVANKLAGEMTMSSIGAKNGGMPASNFSVAERQFIEGLYPNIENQAGGNRAVTDVLTAMEQRKLQMADGWASYKDQQRQTGKPLSYEDYEDQFRQAHAQDNIFSPIIQKYQAGGYTPTAPTAGGQGAAASQVAGSGTAGTAPAAPPQGGGQPTYMPGASAPATASAAPVSQGQPSQGSQTSNALAEAQAAIARGAPRAAVIQRLQSMGINPQGL